MALFQCHACELRREVSNKHVGKQVECPQCKTLVTVTLVTVHGAREWTRVIRGFLRSVRDVVGRHGKTDCSTVA